MPRIKLSTYLFCSLLIVANIAMAKSNETEKDATKGFLYGYLIGDVLNSGVNPTYYGRALEFKVETPEASKDVGTIKILTTPETHTITRIDSLRNFTNYFEASNFLNKLNLFLLDKYGKTIGAKNIETYEINFSGLNETRTCYYKLGVAKELQLCVQGPTSNTPKNYRVFVFLQHTNTGDIQKQLQREYEIHLLNSAKTKDAIEGL